MSASEFASNVDLQAASAPLRFALADDDGGRFVIDDESGVVMLSSEAILQRDRGQTRRARVRVIETDGRTYEVSLRLKITGLTPTPADMDCFSAPETAAHPGCWAAFAAFHAKRAAFGAGARAVADAPFGAATSVAADTPFSSAERAALSLPQLIPAPAGDAAWRALAN